MCKYCCDVGEKKVRPHEISFYAGDPPRVKIREFSVAHGKILGRMLKKFTLYAKKKLHYRPPPFLNILAV